ncbi:MAG: Na+/H+ antiporter NhaA [Chloroflexota bacterium]
MHRVRHHAARIIEPVQAFIQTEAFGGFVLIAAAALAIVWANAWDSSYTDVFTANLHLNLRIVNSPEDLRGWINDGLMTFFFLIVGLEIKRELLHGELRGREKALLPCVSAVGGMILPALVFTAVNLGGTGAHGWGVPMATDIAFALGVLALLGKRIPSELRVFLLALAIVDDIGAILVIAVFYSSDLDFAALGIALALLALVFALTRLRVRPFALYAIIGVAAWAAMHESGVHATLAGVALGLLAPIEPMTPDGESPLERLESALHPWTSYAIIPLFALANAGIVLNSGVVNDASTSRVTLGIAAGLLIGKPLGIFAFAYAAVRLGMASLPRNVDWPEIFGVGVIGGVGFTVALFINGLAFDAPSQIEDGKIGIFGASLIAGVVGFLLLRAIRPHPDDDPAQPQPPDPEPATGR